MAFLSHKNINIKILKYRENIAIIEKKTVSLMGDLNAKGVCLRCHHRLCLPDLALFLPLPRKG